MTPEPDLIDDLRHPAPRACNGNDWSLISDRVMGGISAGQMQRDLVGGRAALRMTGLVRLENDGGFIQMALDLGPAGQPLDAARWAGVQLDVFGNDQAYNLHLRTTEIRRPWESFRLGFAAPARWVTLRLAFADLVPHRTSQAFNPARLRRIGLVAIGRAFMADLAVADLRFYAD